MRFISTYPGVRTSSVDHERVCAHLMVSARAHMKMDSDTISFMPRLRGRQTRAERFVSSPRHKCGRLEEANGSTLIEILHNAEDSLAGRTTDQACVDGSQGDEDQQQDC